MAVVCETGRLHVRHFSLDDAPFIVRLLNEPSFIRHIADKGVRTPDDARTYLRNGPLGSYGRNGFGLSAVVHRDSGATIGMCGLIRRDGLPDVDIGYAFLPEFWSQGYAAGACVVAQRRPSPRAAARGGRVNPDNAASIRLLQSLGFGFETMVVSESTPIQQLPSRCNPAF
jgi:RimJ/RimL family protein N-acetyltransferase